MSTNKYAEEIEKEKRLVTNRTPFKKKIKKVIIKPKENPVEDYESEEEEESEEEPKKIVKKPYYEPKEKPNNYFNLILGSDHEDLELDLRGLRYVHYNDELGNPVVELERKEGHYLSETGAEDLIMELKGHLSTDIKLGFLTNDEFLKIQQIISKTIIKYIRNNLERLGMDTEEKQRKARPLIVMLLNRIRSVYSQSIGGSVNKSSHGDISLSGGLDAERDEKYHLENEKK